MAVAQATSVTRRRVVFGANVLLQIVVAVLVTVGIVWVARGRGQLDWTRSGANSLTPRTRQLLGNLKTDVRITAVYTVLSEYDERAQKRQKMVGDLLKLYEGAGKGHVTANLVDPMQDRAQLPALLKRLRDKPAYQDEAKTHAAALDEFPKLSEKLLTLLETQTSKLEQLLLADPALKKSALAEVPQELGRLRQEAEHTTADIQEALHEDLPRYGRAIEAQRKYLQTVDGWFRAVQDWVQKRAAGDPSLTPAALSLMQDMSREYEPLLAEVKALLDKTQNLARLKLEELADELSRWANAPPIIVETDQAAEVLRFFDVWPARQNPNAPSPDGDTREFAGEQALSSALLRLTEKDKTALVFIRFGGPSPITPDFSQMNQMQMQMPRAPFGELNELLSDENFVTRDWDLSTAKEAPQVEDAVRTAYVVMPPAPPPRPDPRRPSPEAGISADDIELVKAAVEKAGMAIFLASCSEPGVGGSGNYEYADYLRDTWGIDVAHHDLVLCFTPRPDKPEFFVPRPPVLEIDTTDATARVALTDHPITAPLHGSNVGFFAACPVQPATGDKTPQDVHVAPLGVVQPSSDVWAIQDVSAVESDLQTQRGTTRKPGDLAPPFPVAVAAEKGEKRLVVVGSTMAFADNLLEKPGGYAFVGGGLVAFPAYPGNPDFFINSVHWLTHEADRISVGAKGTEVPRLDKLTEGPWLNFWRIFLVGLWPGCALLIGGGVWFFRRR